MVYLFNLVVSLIYTYNLGRIYGTKKLNTFSFFALSFPIILLWIIICGSQNNVGSDYPAYIELFNGFELDRYEPGFVLIINICNSLNISGQPIYYLFYSIGFFFLFLIFKDIPFRYLYIFIFLYLCVSGLFHNQLNILRQVIATYIGTYGAINIVHRRRMYGSLFIIVASLIHFSALIFFLMYLLVLVKHINPKYLLFILGFAIILSFILNFSLIERLDFLVPTYYIRFIRGGTISIEERSLLLKITKYILVPIYVLSIRRLIKGIQLDDIQLIIYKIGIIAFCLKITILNLTIISRIFDIFLIFTLYPLFFYLKYLIEHRKLLFLSLLVSFLMFIYMSKILLFPSGEYLYRSIIPTYF